ncbi:glycosyltransferase family 1 protein [Gilvibacter sp.]|uniref:glycosyltransferase family 4 protein n=1 Tax=Gilvibacter sp. TaxID=2729997 RepID=UPI0025C08436|nr:glycosyltransferase family 1 protein [Gilvibacter sp.]NQX76323.1 glycosyltransferase family 4 protein [Gilvibacter sp.]
MRIGIEAQRLFRPEKHGMDRAVLELIKNLQVLDHENEYFIFVQPDEDSAVIQETANFNIVEVDAGSYPVWEQIKLPKVAKKLNCDILHCTSNTAPLFTATPLMTTIHDVIYMEGSVKALLKSKASAYQKFGNLYRRLIFSKVAKNSKQILTVSEFEKENITAHLSKTEAEKLTAIHNGVSGHFHNERNEQRLQEVREKYGLPQNYMLHLGSKDPRKNTKRVLQAFGDYLKASGETHKLVLMGYNKTTLQADLAELQLHEVEQHIILPGYVADQDLPQVFQMAELFLFPSLREGFGIPVIEAMACGIPVITSNTSSMPEVAGDAAHLVDPYSTEQIVSAIASIRDSKVYYQSLVAKGLNRAKEFSWEAMAQKVLEKYKVMFNQTQNLQS